MNTKLKKITVECFFFSKQKDHFSAHFFMSLRIYDIFFNEAS